VGEQITFHFWAMLVALEPLHHVLSSRKLQTIWVLTLFAFGALALACSNEKGSPIKALVNDKKVVCPDFSSGLPGAFERLLPS
jgi:hypothetical protein